MLREAPQAVTRLCLKNTHLNQTTKQLNWHHEWPIMPIINTPTCTSEFGIFSLTESGLQQLARAAHLTQCSTWLFMTRKLKWLLIRQSHQHCIWTAYWFSNLESLFLLLTILRVNIIKACVKPLWKAWFDDPWTFSTWPKLLLRSTISRLIALAAQLQQWLECASLKVIPMYATTRINYIATWDTVASIIVKSTTQSFEYIH